MDQLTPLSSHYSQSERLIKIEHYVNGVIRREGVYPRYWSASQQREYSSGMLRELPKLLSFYQPDHEYSEHIEAFWHACEKQGFLDCGYQTRLAGQLIHPGADSVAIMEEFDGRIAEYAETPRFRRQTSDRRYEQQQRRERLDTYTRSLMGRYARSLVLRVDLGYYKAARVDILAVYRHLDAFLDLIHRRMDLFDDTTGYAWCVEQGETRGYHIHFTLVLPGHLHQRDGYLTNRLGALWGEITSGMGSYHSCNAEKAKFASRGTLGIGMIHREDNEAIENVVKAVGYLAKPEKEDQFLRMKPVGRRAYGTGMFDRSVLKAMA